MRPKLQVSNGYSIDLPQTARLLQWLEEKDLPRWKARQASEDLGLAERMVDNLVSLAVAMGMVAPITGRLTPLGLAMRRIDPFLSSDIAPWVIHYNLCASPRHLVWYRMANDVVCPSSTLSMADARAHFADLQDSHSAYSASKHLTKELAVFFQAYTEGALCRLSYLEEQDGQTRTPLALKVPPAAFGYALLTYASVYRDGDAAIPIQDIASAESSPGRVYLMRDYDVHQHLERMHRDGVISIESRAHLDQIRVTANLDPADYVAQHYGDTLEDDQ